MTTCWVTAKDSHKHQSPFPTLITVIHSSLPK